MPANKTEPADWKTNSWRGCNSARHTTQVRYQFESIHSRWDVDSERFKVNLLIYLSNDYSQSKKYPFWANPKVLLSEIGATEIENGYSRKLFGKESVVPPIAEGNWT